MFDAQDILEAGQSVQFAKSLTAKNFSLRQCVRWNTLSPRVVREVVAEKAGPAPIGDRVFVVRFSSGSEQSFHETYLEAV